MSQIDWSNAPEWAGSVWRGPLSGSLYWVEVNGKKTQRLRDGFTGAVFYTERWEKICGRPSTEWNGTGLPPVGTVCEVKSIEGWHRCTVFAIKPGINSDEALYDYAEDDGRPAWSSCASPDLFRPIRTPEQIATKEREKAIEEMLKDAGYTEPKLGAHLAVANLYDAGYRKQPTNQPQEDK